MKENKGISSIFLLVISIIILIVAGVFWMYSQGMFDKKEEKQTNQVTDQTQKIASNYEDEEDDFDEDETDDEDWNWDDDDTTHVSTEILETWCGKYVGDSDKKYIIIYRDSRDTLAANFVLNFGSLEKGNIKVENKEKIVYEDTLFDETEKLELNFKDGNLVAKVSSTDNDSLLNEMDGTYKKDENTRPSTLDGYYENDDYNILLTSDYEDHVIIMISSFWQRYTNKFDENKIDYDGDFFDDKEKLVIEKTATGIKITDASSTNSDDILNEIKGIELKKIVD